MEPDGAKTGATSTGYLSPLKNFSLPESKANMADAHYNNKINKYAVIF